MTLHPNAKMTPYARELMVQRVLKLGWAPADAAQACGVSVRTLRRQIPYTLAAEILLTGRHVTAQEALDFGLIGRVVPSGQALAEARKITAEIVDNAPLSIRALMRMLREIDESYSEADALAKELEIGGPVFATKDAREGPRAFAEKRKPVYRGE